MLIHCNDIAAVVSPDDTYIDGFISTDFGEFEHYLGPLGFFDAPASLKVPESSLENEVDWVELVLSNKRTGLVIECADMPLPDSMQTAKKLKADLGFIPMSRFRVHARPTNGVVRELAGVVQALLDNRQNVTIVNPSYTKAHVRCSEFYI